MGLLCPVSTYKVYGLLTTTRTKILIVLTTDSGTWLRDNDVRHLLRNIHSIYMEATASNPFHVTGTPIKSHKFDDRIRSLLTPPDRPPHPY